MVPCKYFQVVYYNFNICRHKKVDIWVQGPKLNQYKACVSASQYVCIVEAAVCNRLLFFQQSTELCREHTRPVIKSFIIQLDELFRNFPTSSRFISIALHTLTNIRALFRLFFREAIKYN